MAKGFTFRVWGFGTYIVW